MTDRPPFPCDRCKKIFEECMPPGLHQGDGCDSDIRYDYTSQTLHTWSHFCSEFDSTGFKSTPIANISKQYPWVKLNAKESTNVCDACIKDMIRLKELHFSGCNGNVFTYYYPAFCQRCDQCFEEPKDAPFWWRKRDRAVGEWKVVGKKKKKEDANRCNVHVEKLQNGNTVFIQDDNSIGDLENALCYDALTTYPWAEPSKGRICTDCFARLPKRLIPNAIAIKQVVWK